MKHLPARWGGCICCWESGHVTLHVFGPAIWCGFGCPSSQAWPPARHPTLLLPFPPSTQFAYCMEQLGLPEDKVNPNGGGPGQCSSSEPLCVRLACRTAVLACLPGTLRSDWVRQLISDHAVQRSTSLSLPAAHATLKPPLHMRRRDCAGSSRGRHGRAPDRDAAARACPPPGEWRPGTLRLCGCFGCVAEWFANLERLAFDDRFLRAPTQSKPDWSRLRPALAGRMGDALTCLFPMLLAASALTGPQVRPGLHVCGKAFL